MKLSYLLLLAFVYGAESAGRKATTPAPKSSGGDLTDECPESNGFFADGYQCDKYYECRDGVIEEKFCPDGMVFNDYSPQVEKCDLPFNIDCSDRPELQQPKPSQHCPRQNGYFAHEDTSICDKFYFCVDGKYNMIQCPAGLVYNEKTGICTWPDEAKKKGCSSQEILENDWLERKKRQSFWPNENQIEKRNDKKNVTDESPPSDDYENVESSNEYDDYDRSREESDEYSDSGEQSSGEAPDYDYDIDMDEVIKAYIAQMNDPSAGVKSVDLSFYEKIGEVSVDRSHDTSCEGDVSHTLRIKVFKFDCPKIDLAKSGQQHPRYPDPEDCQFFYVCINGETPRRNGCKHGQVFNEATGNCDWPRNVPECKDWYKGILTDEELFLLEHPKPRTRSNSTSAGSHRRKQQIVIE